MPLVSLKVALDQAEARKTCCFGFVCQGWEDSHAYVQAGEITGQPVILSAGPGARRNMPVALWGQMFRTLAEQSHAQVIAHLDHGTSLQDIHQALDAGFSSVMFDGSALPLAENISVTNQVTKAAYAYGASVEAEVGQVGYQGGALSEGTTLKEAQTFEAETDVTALAISIGNLHLQTTEHAVIDWRRLAQIESVTTMPLVLHGGSGILPKDRRQLSTEYRIRKINVGTEIRQAYGRRLREILAQDSNIFDRTDIMLKAVEAIRETAIALTRSLDE